MLIIHHWDADGICTASLLIDELAKATVCNIVPEIGFYRINKRIIDQALKGWDAVLVADLRLPDQNLRSLRDAVHCDVLFLDHHLGNTPEGVIGFSALSRKGAPTDYPSTSWMMKDLLELPVSLRCLLGLLGDKGSFELFSRDAWTDVATFLSERMLDESVLLRMVELLNSSARVGDESLVEQAVQQLSETKDSPEIILSQPVWTRNAAILEEEIQTQLKQSDEVLGGVLVKKFRSKFDIISAVARRLAASGRNKVVLVLNTGFLADHDQFYIRRGTGAINAPGIIQMAAVRGYSAGGKEEVVGIVVPKSESEEFLVEILSELRQRRVPP